MDISPVTHTASTSAARSAAHPAKNNADALPQTEPQDFCTTTKPTRDASDFPLNVLMPVDDLSLELSNQVKTIFKQYYNGQIDKQTVSKELSDMVGRLRGHYTNLGYDSAEITDNILQDVYEDCRVMHMSAAGEANFLEGKKIAAQYNGPNRSTGDWIYYDAKYYYQTEDMKSFLHSEFQAIAAKYGETEIEFSTDFEGSPVRKSLYSSYNTMINQTARQTAGNILDESMVPPEGFRLFYKGNESGTNTYSLDHMRETGDVGAQFDGVMQIWCGDWSFSGYVPVRQDPTKFPISLNALDIVRDTTGGDFPQALADIVKNFDFFTLYNLPTYQALHPRSGDMAR